MDCFNGANVCTSTTVSAYIRVNFVDVALRYCFYRTFVDAGSASSTIIINNVSHFNYIYRLNKFRLQKYLIFLNKKRDFSKNEILKEIVCQPAHVCKSREFFKNRG